MCISDSKVKSEVLSSSNVVVSDGLVGFLTFLSLRFYRPDSFPVSFIELAVRSSWRPRASWELRRSNAIGCSFPPSAKAQTLTRPCDLLEYKELRNVIYFLPYWTGASTNEGWCSHRVTEKRRKWAGENGLTGILNTMFIPAEEPF